MYTDREFSQPYSSEHSHYLTATSWERQNRATCDVCRRKGDAIYCCERDDWDICGNCYYETGIDDDTEEFKEICILICQVCGYLEHPGCGNHHCLLSVKSETGMRCAFSGCRTDSALWRSCRFCQSARPKAISMKLRVREAQYVKYHIQNVPVLNTAILLCTNCKAFEYPGTRNGLVRYYGGSMLDYRTSQPLSVSNWRLHHYPSCRSPNVKFYGVILSRIEADYVAQTIARTANPTMPSRHDIDILEEFLRALFINLENSSSRDTEAVNHHENSRVREITSIQEFKSLTKNGRVAVDFSAAWCRPCAYISPKFASLSHRYANVVFAKVEYTKHKEIMEDQDIGAYPTFRFYKNGSKVNELVGADEDSLVRMIEDLSGSARLPVAVAVPIPETDATVCGAEGEHTITVPAQHRNVLSRLINANKIQIDRSNTRNVLGRGAFGEVWRGKYDDKVVAVKVLQAKNRTKEQQEDFLGEIEVLMDLKHSNVVKFIGVAIVNREWMLVQQFCAGGSMDKALQHNERVKSDIDLRFSMLIDAANGINHLHQNRIIHFDLKPGNLLMDEHLRVKVADFGLAKALQKNVSTVHQEIGTVLYMAPEVALDATGQTASDIFSFGVIIYEVLTLLKPYADVPFNNHDEFFRFIANGGRATFPSAWEGRQRKKLVESCWEEDPSDRPSIGTVIRYLEIIQNANKPRK